uniref:Zona pellucida sperm-binding protein 3 n=1 Tax=Myripristis murdjan TaxID=586833 RepID=A0A667ZPU3_9TELE
MVSSSETSRPLFKRKAADSFSPIITPSCDRAADLRTDIQTERPEAKISPDFASLPDVSVTCSTSDLVVRVKTAFYGFGANAEELKLGTCKSNGVLGPYGDLLFTYPLTECGAKREMPPGYLVYKYVLHYAPSPKWFPSRAHRIDVNIECRFQRYHHVRQLAVRPTWRTAVVRKRLKAGLKAGPNDFQVQLMDGHWTGPVKSRVYQLGENVNFQVSASRLPPGGKLYINSCYATLSSGSKSSIKYTIIDNFGCMVESQRDPGASHFVSPRTDKTLRFSFRAFQFIANPDTEVYIHCKLLVTSKDPSPAHKSCTYRESKWKALTGDDSICECCDSRCLIPEPRRAMMEGSASSGPMLVSDQPHRLEDGFLPVTTSLVSMSTHSNPEDTVVFETKMSHQTTEEMHSPDYDVDDVDDAVEDQQSYRLLQEEKSRIIFDGVKEAGLDEVGFRDGLFEDERKMSGMTDLEEFAVDGSGYVVTQDYLQREESGSQTESERGPELRAVDGKEDDVFDEKQLSHLQEQGNGQPPHGVGVKEMLASEIEVDSQSIKTLREDKVQPPETQSKEEKGEKNTGRDEEPERATVSKTERKKDDGQAEAETVDSQEMTWYFTWM